MHFLHWTKVGNCIMWIFLLLLLLFVALFIGGAGITIDSEGKPETDYDPPKRKK